MSSDNLLVRDDSCDGSRHDLDKIWNKFGKIITYLVSDSAPMSKTDKVGLTFTIIAFGIILAPLALSDSDPYQIKWLLDEVIGIVLQVGSVGENQDTQYTIIVHLKTSQESHLDATEKIILGKYRSFTN